MNGHELILAFQAGRADFTAENLEGIKLSNAHLNGIILDGADMREADLNGVSLFAASLRGTMLNRAHLGIAHDYANDINLDDIDIGMDCVNLAKADMTGAFLNNAH